MLSFLVGFALFVSLVNITIVITAYVLILKGKL